MPTFWKKKSKTTDKDLKEGSSKHGSKMGVHKPVGDLLKQKSLDELLRDDQLEEELAIANIYWYHGNLTREEAEEKLTEGTSKSGYFLIRDSSSRPDEFALACVNVNTIQHYAIHLVGHSTYSFKDGPAIYGLDEFVKYYSRPREELPCPLTLRCTGQQPPASCLKMGYTNLLHRAISEGNIAVATKILKNPNCPDVNRKDSNGSTALHLACQQNCEMLVWPLLDHGAHVDVRDADGYTALARASMANKVGVISILVRKGDADIQGQNLNTGNVPLHEVAIRGHTESLKMLLTLNAPCWPRNEDKKFPHDLAKENGHKVCASILDEYKVSPAKTKQMDWFHRQLDRQGAMDLISKQKMRDGLFLIRPSTRHQDRYVLSMTHSQNPYNFEIQTFSHRGLTAYFIDDGPLLESLEHLIQHYCLFTDGLPCKLKYAITPGGKVKDMNISLLPEEEHKYIQGYCEEGYEAVLKSAEPSLPKPSTIPHQPAPPPPQMSPPADSPPPPPSTSPPPLQGGAANRRSTQKGPKSFEYAVPQLSRPIMLDPKSVQLGYEIGQGEYGNVYRGTWTISPGKKMEVAIKTLNEDHINLGKEEFFREARVMMQLQHPCIVKLVGICEGPLIMLVQELVPMGSLLDYLLDYPERIENPKDLVLWAAQIASGMMYLEAQRFVHRDLAARNILLASKEQAKVGDFGLSRAIGAGSDYYKASVGGRWPLKWYAPESVNFGNFSSASDVWSYGVTVWEMFSMGEKPYGDLTGAQVVQMIDRGGRLEKPKDCPMEVYEVMCECWSYEAPKRPKFKDLFDFFSSISSSKHVHPSLKNLKSLNMTV